MSTSIHNGYLLKEMTMTELQLFSKKVREKMKEKAFELAHKQLAHLVVRYLDSAKMQTFKIAGSRILHDLKEENLSKNDISRILKCIASAPSSSFEDEVSRISTELVEAEIEKLSSRTTISLAVEVMHNREREIKRTMRRDPEFDFTCNFVVVPHNDKLFALLYTEQKEMREIWESFEEVTPYPYWNGSDGPEDMTYEEWSARGEEWDKALGKRGIPALVGMNIECVLDTPLFERDRVCDFLPSFASRVKREAFDKVISDKTKEITEASGEPFEYEHFFEARDWMDTEEGKKTLETEKVRLHGYLQETITFDDLMKPFKDWFSSDESEEGIA